MYDGSDGVGGDKTAFSENCCANIPHALNGVNVNAILFKALLKTTNTITDWVSNDTI